jgi:hypothetical protein
MVDPNLYYLENGATAAVTWANDLDTYSPSLGEEMRKFVKLDPHRDKDQFNDNHLFLLSHWIRGFTISARGERQWG